MLYLVVKYVKPVNVCQFVVKQLECLDGPLAVLPSMVVFGVQIEDDFGESQLFGRVVCPLDQSATVLPDLQ